MLRSNLAAGSRFADFSQTTRLFREGQAASEAFLARHIGPRRSVRPGVFVAPESSVPPDITPFPRSAGRAALSMEAARR